MAETKELSLADKLNNAIKGIGPVAKDGSNNYQNYRFQSEAAIKAAVKKEMSINGFNIIPHYEVLNQRDIKGRKGINHIVDVMGTFVITDGRKDQELIGTMPGSGMDTGEKAMAKACTSAQKYFFKQLFNISDQEEDPDATDSNIGAGQQPIHRQQQRNSYVQRGGGQSRQLQSANNMRSQQRIPQNNNQKANNAVASEFETIVGQIASQSGSPVQNVKAAITKVLNSNKEYQTLTPEQKQQKAINVAKSMLGGNN